MTSPSDKRQQGLAIRAYRLRQAGKTIGEIAKELSLKRETVAARIKLGERLVDAGMSAT